MNFLPIAHFDLDAFFASVEQKLNPQLRNKPVIVCGVDSQGLPAGEAGKNVNRGVVSTASYEARHFGIKSGMPVYQARKLCPNGFFIKGHFEKYQLFSKAVFPIIEKYIPYVYRVNLDEGFLDLSGTEIIYPNSIDICDKIKTEIKEKIGITVSIGLAHSKVFAKIACNIAKPDGILAIRKRDEGKIIYPLPVAKLPGVGPKTEEILKSLNIITIGDITANHGKIIKRLGKHGQNLYLSAMGADNIWFEQKKTIKSIGRSVTFPRNTNDNLFILSVLFKLCEEVFYEMFEKQKNAKCVEISIRYPNFVDKQKSHTITSSPLTSLQLFAIAKNLLLEAWDKTTRLRLIGISVSKLEDKTNLVYSRLTSSIYQLREKYGKEIVKQAFTLDSISSI